MKSSLVHSCNLLAFGKEQPFNMLEEMILVEVKKGRGSTKHSHVLDAEVPDCFGEKHTVE